MQGVAIVGASERKIWTLALIRNLEGYGYGGELWLINPNQSQVAGHPCLASLRDVPGEIELGVVILGTNRVIPACEELLLLGARRLIVVSNGFRETGRPEGVAAESTLRELAARYHAQLIGPNCVGYASFRDGICAITEPIPMNLEPGSVSVVSQSGALISGLLSAISHDGNGLDQCFSIGNGAAFDFADAIASLASRQTTRVICGILEDAHDKERLEAAVNAGRANGQEHVILLLGQSAAGKHIAQSHTGAVISEQSLVRAWLEDLGVIVVDSIEEMARTATLLGALANRDRGSGVLVIYGSGGGTGMAADLADIHGVPLSALSDSTKSRLSTLLQEGSFAGNPLDLGGVLGSRDEVYDLVLKDPSVGIALQPYSIVWPDESRTRQIHRDAFEMFAKAAAKAAIPVVIASVYPQGLTEWMSGFAKRTGITVVPGLDSTMKALAKLYRADSPSGGLAVSINTRFSGARSGDYRSRTVVGEAEGRELVESAGLPTVRGVVVDDVEAGVALARELKPPWVLKLAVKGVGHKERVGGVRVGLVNEDDLRRAFLDIQTTVAEVGLAAQQDVRFLIEEMVFGPEILVGGVRDPFVGPSVVVGMGGWAAEGGFLFGRLPSALSHEEISQAVARWSLARLVGEERAAGLATFLAQFSKAFIDGGLRQYSVVECNPVILTTSGPAIADVLLVDSCL